MLRDDKPHSKNLRVHRRKGTLGTFLVTKCLTPKKPALDGELAKIICDTFCYYGERGEVLLAAFVVMPDHWHAILGILKEEPLCKRMHTLGSWIGRHTKSTLAKQQVAWQDGFFETRIRSAKQFKYGIHYIENNPVKAELVSRKEQWEWSSANSRYSGFVTTPWPWRFEQDID